MPRDIVAWALAQSVKSEIEDGSIVAARAIADENGVNINTYYAKIADIPYISTDIYPYTDEEIDEILGIS